MPVGDLFSLSYPNYWIMSSWAERQLSLGRAMQGTFFELSLSQMKFDEIKLLSLCAIQA